MRSIAAIGSIRMATLACCFAKPSRASIQSFSDLNGVQCSSFQQLVRRGENRDGVTGGIAEIVANAADQNVILT